MKKIKVLIASLGLIMIGAVGANLINKINSDEKTNGVSKVEEQKQEVEKESDKKEAEDKNDDSIDEENEKENIDEEKGKNEEKSKDTASEESKADEEPKEDLKVKYLNKLNECNDKVQEIRNESAVDENNAMNNVMLGYASKEFEVWDVELNLIWKDLGYLMKQSEFEELRKEQVQWLEDNTKWEEDLFEREGFQLYQRLNAIAHKTQRTKDRCFELVNTYM